MSFLHATDVIPNLTKNLFPVFKGAFLTACLSGLLLERVIGTGLPCFTGKDSSTSILALGSRERTEALLYVKNKCHKNVFPQTLYLNNLIVLGKWTYTVFHLRVLLLQFSLTLYLHCVYVRATLSIKLLQTTPIS